MRIEYHKLFTHFVLTTNNRLPLIQEGSRLQIEKFIANAVSKLDCKLLAVYANPEHVHLLVERCPDISDEELIAEVAERSEKYINDFNLTLGEFAWYKAASAFSISKGDVERISDYIHAQPEHHAKNSFEDEYQNFLRNYKRSLEESPE